MKNIKNKEKRKIHGEVIKNQLLENYVPKIVVPNHIPNTDKAVKKYLKKFNRSFLKINNS